MSESPQTNDRSEDTTLPTSRRSWLFLLAGGVFGPGGSAIATAAPVDDDSADRLEAADDPDDVSVLSVHAYGEGGYGEGVYGGVEIIVETSSAGGIDDATATLRGELIATGGNSSVDVSFEYGTGGSLDQTADAESLSDEAEFETEIVDLSADTVYEFRAVGAANGDTGTGNTQSFQTLEEGQSQLCGYTAGDGTVQTSGVRAAVRDWQSGELTTSDLSTLLSAWSSGDPVDGCA